MHEGKCSGSEPLTLATDQVVTSLCMLPQHNKPQANNMLKVLFISGSECDLNMFKVASRLLTVPYLTHAINIGV